MTVSVTLQFSDMAEAVRTLCQMSGAPLPAVAPVITHADRPDVGAPLPPAAPVAEVQTAVASAQAAAVFGGTPAAALPGVVAALPGAAVVPATPPESAPVAPVAPPAASSVPTAATGQTGAPAGDLDKNGLPWDSRIHSGSKKMNADGTWRAGRNLNPEFVAGIEAELRTGVAARGGTPVAAVAPVAAPAQPPAPPPVVTAAAPVAPPVPPAAPVAETFATYMARIGGLYTASPVKAHEAMTKALGSLGPIAAGQPLTAIGQLAGCPQYIPVVDAEFQRLMAA